MKVRAETTFRADKHRTRAEVPTGVRDELKALAGDRLIFETGCEEAIQRAALSGTYFVVRLVRAPANRPADVPPPPPPVVRQVEPPVEQPVTRPAPPVQLEPFAEVVRRRLGGRR